MSHDQLSKSLIASFFPDFLRLALPDSALRLRLGEVTFLDKELFTDWPAGSRRELDLLARVPAEEGELSLLVHVEIEAEARAGTDQRLWRYYMQLRLRHDLLVVPILVNLKGGRPGVELEVLEEGFEPLATGVFRYRVLGLSGCQAEDWLSRPEPVAWAFAALMRPGRWSRAELKLACLRRVGESEVAGGRKEILVNWVETYVELTPEDAAEFRHLLEQEENREVQEMEMTWLGRAEAQGVEKGLAQGMEKGIEVLRGVVLDLMDQRFGEMPAQVRQRVQAIDSMDTLAQISRRILTVSSIEDLHLS